MANQKLGMLIYENAQPMDIIGPWEVLSFWKSGLDAPIDLVLVAEQGGDVTCVNQITLKAHVDFAHCPPLDYLIVPGGSGRLQQVHNERVIRFIQQQAQHCRYVLSDCTGMFLLHQAGLLADQTATTYWRALPELKAFTDVKVREERIVKSGKVWTAGGVSSGIDLALELIAAIAGPETAGQVQLLFEYFPKHQTYCTATTAQSLPPYNGKETGDLPEYIKTYLSQTVAKR